MSNGPGRSRRPSLGGVRWSGALRSVVVAGLVALLVPAVTLASSGRALAQGSAMGLASNAWLVSELAADAMTAIPQSSEVTEWERTQAAAATTTTTAAAGLDAKPKAGGKLGMILNTVGVLGGLSFLWPGGEDAPALPNPAAEGAPTNGDPATGMWTTGTPVLRVTFNATRTQATVTTTASFPPGYSRYGFVSVSGPSYWTQALPSDQLVGFIPQPEVWHFEFRAGASLSDLRVPGKYTVLGKLDLAPRAGTIGVPTTGPALVPRYIDSQITCKSGADNEITLQERTGPFTFDPAQPFTMPEVPDMVCPDGMWLDSGKRTLHTEGTPDTADVPLDVPYERPDWVEEQSTRFPECAPVGSQQCQLKLFKVGTSTQPEHDCHAFAPGSGNPCQSWFSDPDRGTKYECRYGSNVVALKQCAPYRDLYKTPTPTITPTPTAEPEAPVPGVDPTPETTPELGDCTPNWAELLTPWWVFKATACALEWAFVPNPSSWGVDQLVQQVQARPPASIVVALGGVAMGIADGFTGAGDCGTIADFSSEDMDAKITCDQIRSVPGFSVLYWLITAGLVALTGMGLFKMFSGVLESGS